MAIYGVGKEKEGCDGEIRPKLGVADSTLNMFFLTYVFLIVSIMFSSYT